MPIKARRLELTQLFQNLLTNAINYRSQDAGQVEIRQEESDGMWRFSVIDDGIGIHPKHHERIFQLFQRTGSEGQVEGTGVGLALVKKIVDSAGGSIQVQSDLGKGAAFVFTWPMDR
jgi:signal transduction histidine kinase